MLGNGNGNGSGSRWWQFLRRRSGADQDTAPYRRLAMQLIHELPPDVGGRSVMLVTPAYSNLCARGSAVLAGCLAEQLDRRVLFVDACPRRPDASLLLQSSATRGFSELLADPTLALSELVLPTSNAQVEFLCAGLPRNSQAAAGQNAETVMRAIAQQYDFAVFCGGPVLTDSATLALAPHVGCVLLLAIENETRLEDLDAAKDALNFCKARRIGLVLTTPVRKEWSLA